MVVAAGAAGGCFLEPGALQKIQGLKLVIDLNAVPPAGIPDIDVTDKGAEKSGMICYGAVGVGGLKMKVHRKAIAALFESNDRVLEIRGIYDLAVQVAGF
jgi:methylenetetrahydrofolate/methylenetetrahydromethanopterin dehydrogenase (NADP+)